MSGGEAGWKTIRYRDIVVRYSDELCGGGDTFGQDFLRVLGDLGGTDRLMEWCCGVGFIGFSLLAHGLCRRLVLVDTNPRAIAACRETIRLNGLEERVRAYVSHCLDRVPEREKVDVVVANPPHSGSHLLTPSRAPDPLIYQDPDWRAHQRFLLQVGSHLADPGLVILQENSQDSDARVFEPFIAAGGLRLRQVLPCPVEVGPFYYICADNRPTRRS